MRHREAGLRPHSWPRRMEPMPHAVRRVFLVLLIAIAVCGSLLGVLAAAQASPRATLLAELSSPIRSAAPFGRDVLVAAGADGLLIIREGSDEAAVIYKLTGQEIINVLVSEGTIYAVSHVLADRTKQLHVVDPAGLSVKRTVPLGGSVSDVAGFLPDGRLIVIEGGQVRFIDPERGRTRGRVPVPGGLLGRGHLVGDKLYVARSYDGGIAEIDTKMTTLLRIIEVGDWLRRVQVIGRRALVTGSQQGHGVVDLDTRSYDPLDVLDYYVNDEGEAFVLDGETLSRYDYGGHRSAQRDLPGALADDIAAADPSRVRLLAMTNDLALIAVEQHLWKLEFSRKKKKAPEATLSPPPTQPAAKKIAGS